MTSKNTSEEKLPQLFAQIFPEGLVLKNLTGGLGYEKPTPIQQHIIPHILEGRDVYAGARTGSGKTMAFLAPIAQMMTEEKVKKALVLSPTRELALQIDEEAMKLLEGQTDYVSCPLYGGVPLDQQLRAIQIHKPRLFIATPGRMIDFIGEGCLPLADIEVVVLDEADRMCDMGFSDQVTEILRTIPFRKQTLMFSATLPKAANQIMEEFLNNPVRLQLDDPLKANTSITHRVLYVDRRDKTKRLRELIEEPNQTLVIFTRTRKQADQLYNELRRDYSQIGILHAGFSMGEREKTIRAFRESKIQFLIATDVAARGLDIERITKVIHYDLPESAEDYIHRSGRSGRAGRTGETIALVDKSNFAQRRSFQDLQKEIQFEDFEPEVKSQSRSKNLPADDKSRSRKESRNPRPDRSDRKARNQGRPSQKRIEERPEKGEASSFFKKASRLLSSFLGLSTKKETKSESSREHKGKSEGSSRGGQRRKRRPSSRPRNQSSESPQGRSRNRRRRPPRNSTRSD